jgi:hypothetical protein
VERLPADQGLRVMICANCQFENPDGLETCRECGHRDSSSDTCDGELAVVPALIVTSHAESNESLSPAALLAAPLPPPMVEPIQPPNTPRPECQPDLSQSVRTLCVLIKQAAPPVEKPSDSPNPAGQTLTIRPAPSALTVRERISPGTSPATPVLTAPPTQPELPPPVHATSTQTPPPLLPAEPQVRPKLVVLRGQRVNADFPIYVGRNTVGRFADKPVDIDLSNQEAEGQVWSSRLHAAILCDKDAVMIEDLNSLNGTWINGTRIHAGQQHLLKANDVIQIGTVQLKLVVG